MERERERKKGRELPRHWRSYSFGESEGAAGAHLAGEETSREYPQPLFLPGRRVHLALPSPFIDPSPTTASATASSSTTTSSNSSSSVASNQHRPSYPFSGCPATTPAQLLRSVVGTALLLHALRHAAVARPGRGKEKQPPSTFSGSRPTRRPGAHELRRTGTSAGASERARRVHEARSACKGCFWLQARQCSRRYTARAVARLGDVSAELS